MVADLMQCHPWYVQQLSHYTWNRTTKSATRSDILTSLDELLNANLPLYQKETEILSTTQLSLLKAIACGEKHLTSTETMNKYHLGTPRNVSKNREILINKDIIGESEGKLIFLDPAFEIWFRRVFLNASLS